jgi:hypothetical protein
MLVSGFIAANILEGSGILLFCLTSERTPLKGRRGGGSIEQ